MDQDNQNVQEATLRSLSLGSSDSDISDLSSQTNTDFEPTGFDLGGPEWEDSSILSSSDPFFPLSGDDELMNVNMAEGLSMEKNSESLSIRGIERNDLTSFFFMTLFALIVLIGFFSIGRIVECYIKRGNKCNAIEQTEERSRIYESKV